MFVYRTGLGSRAVRIGLLLALAVATTSALSFVPPIPQPLAYHEFADQRTLLGIPNALNVLSNVPFLFIGAAGLLFVRRQPPYPAERHFLSRAERWPWLIFFVGVAFTCAGSAWYHLAPDNARLVWDRLPMTLGFMSLFAAMIAERIDLRAGLVLLGPLLLAGLGSVLHWHWTELGGAGDLRPYAAVQFLPLLLIPLMLLLFPARYTGTADIWVALLWYGLAKLLEALDGQIYSIAQQAISGHSLKHLASATSAWWLLRMLRRRVPSQTRPRLDDETPGGHLMRTALVVGAALLLVACGPPVGVTRVSPRTVTQELTRSALNSSTPSLFSENVLHRSNLADHFRRDPEGAIERLHQLAVQQTGRDHTLFALAELSFAHAEETRKKDYYLQAAVAAWAFLFPGSAEEPRDELDPRLRIATDLYNRGLTQALASADGSVVELRSGLYPLPFGQQVAVRLEPDALRWAGRDLVEFVPVAELRVRGLRSRHRRPGIGAPLAARAIASDPAQKITDHLGANARTSVTALLRIDDARRQMAEPVLGAALEIYSDSDQRTVVIDGREVPLEVEPTAALAWSLSHAPNWRLERRGFFRGDLLRQELPTSLTFVQPFRPGRIPVVFVHGTASSVGRWANMLNDLLNDARVRDRFQFWFFSYASGGPIPYSAMLLRDALTEAVAQLDPEGADPALREMVLIGHSQGGLLVKMTAVDSGTRIVDAISRVPLDELDLTAPTRELLERALIVRPLPFVRRVIFIATPHGGSSLTTGVVVGWLARFVTLPIDVLGATADLLEGNADALMVDPRGPRFGSIYGMRPGGRFLGALAATPIAPGIAAHSIIPVRGAEAGDTATDGVVTFRNARIDGAESELVIPFSGHSVQGHPLTVEEVRRILLEHASVVCGASGVACGPARATERGTPASR